MLIRSRTLLACLVASSLLLVTVSAASANSLSVSSQRFKTVFTELEIVAENGTVRCNLTLEGSFHSATIPKSQWTLIGHITSASVGSCSEADDVVVRLLTAFLPWHLSYESFINTLPSIVAMHVRLVGLAFSWSDWFSCLYATSLGEPLRLTFNRQAGGELNSVATDPAYDINGRGTFCAPARLIGDGSVTTPGGSTVLLRLA